MGPSDAPVFALLAFSGSPGFPEILIVPFVLLLLGLIVWRVGVSKCSNCQKRGVKSGGFCSRCGASLSGETPAAPPDDSPTPEGD
jgi:hypothetical protein